jgi:tRNA(Ile)-lysidine synthase TilS/MesJ
VEYFVNFESTFLKTALLSEPNVGGDFDEFSKCRKQPNIEVTGYYVNACINFNDRKEIDWNKRKEEFINIFEKYKSKDNNNWDCIIPVSGGKDSTYQVYKILKLEYNPLCIISSTCHLSDIGKYNIENLKKLGVDMIEFTANKNIRKKLNCIGLETVGDISCP